MKITSLLVLKTSPSSGEPIILAKASDLSSHTFFYRKNIDQFLVFFSRTIAKRTQPNQSITVQHEDYKVHVSNRDGLCALGFMDDHYPSTSAYSVLRKVLDEYEKDFGSSWKTAEVDSTTVWPYLQSALEKYQDPTEADKVLKVQRELDETKTILHQTISSILERGEKLESLVEMSTDLSAASQMLYRQAKRTNQCCTL